MASVVDICNGALALLGKKQITSLNDAGPEALACRTLWPLLLNKELRDHVWNHSIKRARLIRLTEAPAFEYQYQFQLPADCLRVVAIEPDDFYSVEGRLLLCNQESVNIKYIKKNDDSTVYDSAFAYAMTNLLAGDLCFQFTSSQSSAKGYSDKGAELLLDAKATDSQEGKKPDKRGQRWVNAKLGG